LGVDPTREMTRFVDSLAAAGFDGVMNCPTVTLIDGKFRSDLEETGMGFYLEVEVLGYASRKGLFTKAFCTTPDEALAMAEEKFGAENVACAALLDNLAALYEAEMLYAKAQPLYSRALDLRVKEFGARHPEVVNSLINLALIYDALGDYGAAEKMDARATEIIEAGNRQS